jgi:hypothetical protein
MPKPITFDEVERKRRDFSRTLKDFSAQGGSYHHAAHELSADSLAGCRVFPNRMALLDHLPKGGVVAELGAGTGALSVQILERAAPKTLHIFDADPACLERESLVAGIKVGRLLPHMTDSGVSLATVPDGYLDGLYLSGSTDLADVQPLLELADRKLSAKGVLMVNNYAVWSPLSMYRCDVAHAVNMFCRTRPWKFTGLALQDMGYYDVQLARL